MVAKPLFAPRGTPQEIERGMTFQPKFDGEGLIPAIVTDSSSGAVLMFAWMNAQALALTIETRVGHSGAGREDGFGRRARRAATCSTSPKSSPTAIKMSYG